MRMTLGQLILETYSIEEKSQSDNDSQSPLKDYQNLPGADAFVHEDSDDGRDEHGESHAGAIDGSQSRRRRLGELLLKDD